MDIEKLKIAQELLGELIESMDMDENDFNERLGRKPKMPEAEGIEVTSIEAIPLGEEEEEEEEEDEDYMEMDESPAEKLKNRLMKLRG